MPKENLKASILLARILRELYLKTINYMGYLGDYSGLGQRATQIQAKLADQLDPFCDSATRRERGRKRGAILFALFLAASGTAQAATVNARSPSFADVSTAVSAAKNGDTVVVPAGTASWTKTLVISKPIWLVGQTTVNYTNETASDQTIILDDVSRSSSTPPAPIIHVMLTAGDMSVEPTVPLLLIKGFTFRGSPSTPTGAPNGVIMLSATCPAVRVSNCHFDRLYQGSITTFGWIYGVMDNCLHTITNHLLTGVMGMASYNGQKWGDGSWTEDAHWGSYKFFFTENNVVQNLVKTSGNMDAKRGARYVVRNSKLYDCSFVQTHGTEGDRDRGCRAIEFYNNICTRSNGGPGSPGGLRSGNILFHDNQYKGVPLGNAFLSLVAYRQMVDFQPWQLASGGNSWDQNDPHGLYASGTAATASVVGASQGDTSFYVTGNLSAYNTGGYSIKNTRTGLGSVIHAAVYNSSGNRTLITCGYSIAWPTAKTAFATGDPFEIRRTLRVLDQTGLGAGKLCSGTALSLNGAVDEPSYAWNNTQANGSHVVIQSGGTPNPTFVAGRDYFNSAPPFTYKPYTYPHPLTNAIAPPSNLQVTQ